MQHNRCRHLTGLLHTLGFGNDAAEPGGSAVNATQAYDLSAARVTLAYPAGQIALCWQQPGLHLKGLSRWFRHKPHLSHSLLQQHQAVAAAGPVAGN